MTPERCDIDAGHDAGVATVWAAAGVAVLMAALLVGLHVAAAISARHRAESAADLAALAAAALAVQGTATSCGRADVIAAATGARVTFCALVGWKAAVEVEVDLALSLPGASVATARALAGPADPGPGPDPVRDEPLPALTRSASGPAVSRAAKLVAHQHDGEVVGMLRSTNCGCGKSGCSTPSS